MSRYIDAEKLIEKIDEAQEELKDNEALWEIRKKTYKALCRLRRMIEDIPAADVVPKSEFENLKVLLEMTEKAHEGLRELYRTDTDALVEARIKTETEVAREIFEEIYEECFDQYGYINYEALAELKKKYTENIE